MSTLRSTICWRKTWLTCFAPNNNRLRSAPGWALPRSDPSGPLVAAAWLKVSVDGQFVPQRGRRHMGWAWTPPGPGGDRSRRRPLPGVGPRPRRRELPDQSAAGYTEVTWAEDRATRGRDPRADRGAKTGMGGRTPPLGIPGIGRKAINQLTCCCIKPCRSDDRDCRARFAGKSACSQAITPEWMRIWHETCAFHAPLETISASACKPRDQTYVRICGTPSRGEKV